MTHAQRRRKKSWVAGLIVVPALTAGCAVSPPPPWSAAVLPRLADVKADMGAAAQASPYYDFSWVLSGDRLAAPLQVFDDGRRMWLQFSVSQGRPQLLGGTEQGWVEQDYRVQGAYVVLDAVWPQLQVRVGVLEALVERQTEVQRLQVQQAQQSAPAPSGMQDPR